MLPFCFPHSFEAFSGRTKETNRVIGLLRKAGIETALPEGTLQLLRDGYSPTVPYHNGVHVGNGTLYALVHLNHVQLAFLVALHDLGHNGVVTESSERRSVGLALQWLSQNLHRQDWLFAHNMSVADIACSIGIDTCFPYEFPASIVLGGQLRMLDTVRSTSGDSILVLDCVRAEPRHAYLFESITLAAELRNADKKEKQQDSLITYTLNWFEKGQIGFFLPKVLSWMDAPDVFYGVTKQHGDQIKENERWLKTALAKQKSDLIKLIQVCFQDISFPDFVDEAFALKL